MQLIAEMLISLVCMTWLFKNKDTIKEATNTIQSKAEEMRNKAQGE